MTSSDITRLIATLERTEAVLIGAGSGLSAAAGLTYSGARFKRLFGDFIARYGLTDMYTAGFYPFPIATERWAYWSRHVLANRYDQPDLTVYQQLLNLMSEREYFVITTNVDHAFETTGFRPDRIFATQGDYGRFQCSVPCRQETWANEGAVRAMVAAQANCRIPTSLIPVCPWCGQEAMMHLRIDGRFVQDDEWYAAAHRYEEFVGRYGNGRILLLELGIGGNTPSIIKYPFWQLTASNPNAILATLDLRPAVPEAIAERTIAIGGDIATTLDALTQASQ